MQDTCLVQKMQAVCDGSAVCDQMDVCIETFLLTVGVKHARKNVTHKKTGSSLTQRKDHWLTGPTMLKLTSSGMKIYVFGLGASWGILGVVVQTHKSAASVKTQQVLKSFSSLLHSGDTRDGTRVLLHDKHLSCSRPVILDRVFFWNALWVIGRTS